MNKTIHSPMNYTGGKAKILPFLLGLFPKGIRCFYDLFCGGLNVSLNVDAESVVANDLKSRLMGIYEHIASCETFDELDSQIVGAIQKYKLHDTPEISLLGIAGSDVKSVGEKGYYALRDAYNDIGDPLLLLVLMFYSFNNEIRFNRQFKFNMPIGKSCYNAKNKTELEAMHYILRKRGFSFSSKSFEEFGVDTFSKGDFVYCDPPYLITNAVYNESNNDESGWNEDTERRLYSFLDELDARGILFGLSNAVQNNGTTNTILDGWMRKYKVFHPDIHYSNSSYHHTSREHDTVEVYVTNYKDAVDRRDEQIFLF